MRFCGVELSSIHPAISIAKEIRPGTPARDVLTISGTRGETVAGTRTKQGEYTVRVNIAAKTTQEAWEALAALNGWARASGEKTGVLEPTHWPGKAYDAILSDIQTPKFRFGFGTVEVIFIIPRPYAYDLIQRQSKGGEEIVLRIGGTETARPEISIETETTERVTLLLDGEYIFMARGKYKGKVLTVDFARGTVTYDGEPAEKDVDFNTTDWHPAFTPGQHVLTCEGGKTLEGRWHDEWA